MFRQYMIPTAIFVLQVKNLFVAVNLIRLSDLHTDYIQTTANDSMSSRYTNHTQHIILIIIIAEFGLCHAAHVITNRRFTFQTTQWRIESPNTRNVLQPGSETRGSSHVLPKPLSEPVLTNHQWGLVGSPQYYPHGPSFGPSNLLLHDSNNSNSNNTDVFDEVYFGTVLLDTWFAKF